MSSSNTQHGKMKSKKFSQHIPSPKGEEDEQVCDEYNNNNTRKSKN
jgi:hypothetical protein